MKSGVFSTGWRWAFIIPFVGVVVLLLAWAQRPDGKLRVWVLDVGQGNAVLVRTPLGHTAVIDGGLEAMRLHEGIGRRLPFWQNDLDLVVLTSPEAENVTGLVDLLGRRKVAEIVQTDFEIGTNVQGAWREAAAQSGARVHYAGRGDVIGFAGEPDVVLKVLYPVEDGAIVLRIEYDGVGILLAQNMEKTDEARLIEIEDEGELKSDVLIVPRHGTEDALSTALLEAVEPKVAVISVGADNRAGDPSPDVLQKLLSADARVYRTDIDGTVEMMVDQGQLWMASEKK